MSSVHGEKVIRRTYNGKEKKYASYLPELREDFKHICGYCGKSEESTTKGFEIDHFIPKNLEPKFENVYSNLVYCCHTCNRKKAKKWPTNDVNRSYIGDIGIIDPCDEQYNLNIQRDESGNIEGITPLGKYICREIFKFNIRPMSLIYKLEKLKELKFQLLQDNITIDAENRNKLLEFENKINELTAYIFFKKE